MSAAMQILRTPRGQLSLFGVTLALSLALALLMATQRPFFESLVREKPRAPEGAVALLIERTRRGDSDPASLSAARGSRDALYEAFLRGDPHDHSDDVGDARLASLIVSADARHAASRVERSLVAGTGLQRLRAVELARMAPDAAMVPVLDRALARARRVGTPRLVRAIEGARAAIPSPLTE